MSKSIPPGDNLPRYVCNGCGFVHYENPKVVAGCIVSYESQILLCRRAIDPRYGKWTIPAGFMELSESTGEAAARETLEEACAVVTVDDLFAVYDLIDAGQVYVIYRAALEAPDFAAGVESLDVRLFSEEEIPWDEIAFTVVSRALSQYLANRKANDFRPFAETIKR